MHLSAEWRMGKYPKFNVSVSSAKGKDPFIVIKDCRIVDGAKGEFVSWPAKKMDDGKYFNYVYASKEFVDAVLKVAKEAMPSESKSIEDMSSDIPW